MKINKKTLALIFGAACASAIAVGAGPAIASNSSISSSDLKIVEEAQSQLKGAGIDTRILDGTDFNKSKCAIFSAHPKLLPNDKGLSIIWMAVIKGAGKHEYEKVDQLCLSYSGRPLKVALEIENGPLIFDRQNSPLKPIF